MFSPEVNNKACEVPQNLLPNCMNWQLDRLGPVHAISKKFCRIIEHSHSHNLHVFLSCASFLRNCTLSCFRQISLHSGGPCTKAECIRAPSPTVRQRFCRIRRKHVSECMHVVCKGPVAAPTWIMCFRLSSTQL